VTEQPSDRVLRAARPLAPAAAPAARLEPEDRVRRAERALNYAKAAAAEGCECGNARLRVVSTLGRVRYAICKNCGRHRKIVAD